MRTLLILSMIVFTTFSSANATPKKLTNPQVIIETSKGKIIVELFQDKAPITVENFLNYIRSDFYTGTIFHRVIPGFMIQGGGFTKELQKKITNPPISNEADNGLRNERGTIAMARTSKPHSATSQFFINTVDNDFLNHKTRSGQGWGYAVFGRVVKGIEVVDNISNVRTGNRGGFRDIPVEPVIIKKIVEINMKGAE